MTFIKTFIGGLLFSLSIDVYAQLSPNVPQIMMTIMVVEIPEENYPEIQKEQVFWQDNPHYLVKLLAAKPIKKEAIESRVIARENETIVLGGVAETNQTIKNDVISAHTLTVTPKIISDNQISLLLEDKRNIKNAAKTGGLSYDKVVRERVIIKNKELNLIAMGKVPGIRQLFFITPIIKHEKN